MIFARNNDADDGVIDGVRSARNWQVIANTVDKWCVGCFYASRNIASIKMALQGDLASTFCIRLNILVARTG